MGRVYCIGVFDMLHIGHINLLERAKAKGNHLTVGLVTDTAVQEFKGKNRPIVPQSERMQLLKALRCVDSVVLVDDFVIGDWAIDNHDFIVLGADQYHIKRQEAVPKEKIVILSRTEGVSTTDVIKKIKEDSC